MKERGLRSGSSDVGSLFVVSFQIRPPVMSSIFVDSRGSAAGSINYDIKTKMIILFYF